MFIAGLFDVSMPKHSIVVISDTLHFDIFRNRKSVIYSYSIMQSLYFGVVMFEVSNFLSGAGHSSI